MFKTIATWHQKLRNRSRYQDIAIFDDQLLLDLGLTRQDIEAARKSRATSHEGPVFP